MSDPRFPIGKFSFPASVSPSDLTVFIGDIEQAPAALRFAVAGLSPQQLDTPYREGGWTVRQVTHHVPDSHMNAYVRYKLALTEDEPTIKPYAEDRWAQLADTQSTPIEVSLALLESLHDGRARLLRSLTPGDRKRQFRHPDLGAVAGEKPGALRMARQAPYGARDGVEEEDGVVVQFSFNCASQCATLNSLLPRARLRGSSARVISAASRLAGPDKP